MPTELLDILSELDRLEKDLIKKIPASLEAESLIWGAWLSHITGIGAVLAAQLVHLIKGQVHTDECKVERERYFSKKRLGESLRGLYVCDCPVKEIERFPTVSSLWKYAGLHVVNGKAPKMKRGEKVDWNPKLRSLCWKISDSFVKKRDSPYRKYYDEFKAMEKQKNPELRLRHIDMRARRKTVKLFLAHLFSKWYELKGLKAPEPYPFSMLGHEGYIPPPK